MMALIPGGARRWTDVLPEEYRRDPEVVVVTVKKGATTRVGTSHDGWHVGVLETLNGIRGLQVIGAGGGYLDHQEIIERRYGIPMADPSFIGPLSRLTDDALLSDLHPLVFLRDRLGVPYLPLKQFLWEIAKDHDDGRDN